MYRFYLSEEYLSDLDLDANGKAVVYNGISFAVEEYYRIHRNQENAVILHVYAIDADDTIRIDDTSSYVDCKVELEYIGDIWAISKIWSWVD